MGEIMEISDLQETFYCDFSHPAIEKLANKIAGEDTDRRKITETTFKYVRNNVRFGCDLVKVKASETLTKGYGVCWNKALLLVALLRRNGIPARMGYNLVKREFMKPAFGEEYKTLHNTENHCFTLVNLNNEWVAVDATLDPRTYEKFYAPTGVTWGIEWNLQDSMHLYTENIVGPIRYFEDIDAALKNDVGYAMPLPAEADSVFGPLNQRMWQD
jgi:transglutaminase-like putative cysteine protease